MKTIILSDIFGITPELKQLASELPTEVQLLSPYDDQNLIFEDEATAYQQFSTSTNITQYSQKLTTCIKAQREPVNLIGFSVGASALWLAASNAGTTASIVNKGIGFYSSQIRNHLTLSSGFNIHLIFPEEEAHFDVDSVIHALANKEHVKTSKSTGRHGFMNARSVNFNQKLYFDYLALLLAEI